MSRDEELGNGCGWLRRCFDGLGDLGAGPAECGELLGCHGINDVTPNAVDMIGSGRNQHIPSVVGEYGVLAPSIVRAALAPNHSSFLKSIDLVGKSAAT